MRQAELLNHNHVERIKKKKHVSQGITFTWVREHKAGNTPALQDRLHNTSCAVLEIKFISM